MKKKIPQFLLMTGTILGLAGINYSILHTPFVFIVVLVVLAHELGHYFTASFLNADPDLPYFIPLPFFTIGITRIRKMKLLSYNSRKKILAFGPLTGILTSLLFLLFSIILFPQYILAISCLLFGETLFNFIGSDGKKYRYYSLMERQSWNY